MDNKKLYVGNLDYDVSEQDLADFFSTAGTVQSAKIITNPDSGRSKGFGFVEMGSDAETQEAVSKLNGAELNGRPLTVNEARPQKPRPKRW
ncbi:RNA-binding protein [Patescibacteria group bacterium]|nr:RNA-binding protein [Patescibacteria group bacterium]